MSTTYGVGNGRRITRLAAVLAVAVSLASAGGAVAAAPRPFGDVRVIAPVPNPPGFPEGVAVQGQQIYVSGPAALGTAGGPPSAVLLYSSTSGKLLKTFPTQGENLALEHANVGMALDRKGRAYVINSQLGVYRLLPNGAQEPYGTFPDLPQCGIAPPPCSPTPFDGPAFINDLAFDAAGNLYVTDSLQATIWRVPPGGGVAQIWFQDIRLASTFFGTNGIRISPDGTTVYFGVTQDLAGQGYIYTLPLIPSPGPGDLTVFHNYSGGEAPDGIALARNGEVYVTLASPPASGISILRPDGTERVRLGNPDPSILEPFDSPASLAFDGKGSVVVANHAVFSANPAHFLILDVFVDDPGSPLFLPVLP